MKSELVLAVQEHPFRSTSPAHGFNEHGSGPVKVSDEVNENAAGSIPYWQESPRYPELHAHVYEAPFATQCDSP